MALPLLALGVACASSSDAPVARLDTLADGTIARSHRGLVSDTLVGSVIAAGDGVGDPRGLALVGSHLWIADRAGDPYLHVVDLTGTSSAVPRGARGEGPGDYAELPQLSVRQNDTSAVWAYDATLHRLTREPNDPREARRVMPTLEGVPVSAYSLQWQGRWRVVGIGDMDTNRIVIADSAGALSALVPSALLGPDSAGIAARRAISSGYAMCVQPAGGRIGVLYLAAGQVNLYEADGRSSGRADVPFPNEGEWVLDRRGEIWFRVTWNEYIGCAATERFLYGVYMGQRTDGPAGPVGRRGWHIHRFDWTGARTAVWRLDRPASAIAVLDDLVMYAIGQEGDGIVRYALPPER